MYQFLLLFSDGGKTAIPVVVLAANAQEAHQLAGAIASLSALKFIDLHNLGQVLPGFNEI